MKSKISFFNKTIFKKNVTLYWPVWGIYTFFLLCALPIRLWFNYNDRYSHMGEEDKLIALLEAVEPGFYTFLIAVMATFAGMAIYSYLYNSKSANMIHALPVNRTQLYGTSVISGLAFLIVPQILSFILSVLVCLDAGITRVEYLAMWLGVSIATAIISFAIVTFCAFFTGQLVTLPIYVIIVNFLAVTMDYVIRFVVSSFAYGTSELLESSIQKVIEWLTPLVCYLQNVNIVREYDKLGYAVIGGSLQGEFYIISYLVVAVILYAVAYYTYQKRQIEHAGDLITVRWVKPIFRWGVGTIAGFMGSLMLRFIFMSIGIYINLFVYIIFLLLIGGIFYFLADMFVKKSFRVFRKANWKGCGAFSIVLLLSFAGLYFYSEVEQNYVPKASEVEHVLIDGHYSSVFSGENVGTAIEIHEAIRKNINELEVFEYRSNYTGVDYTYTSIVYILKDGRRFQRYYIIPCEGAGKEILEKLEAAEGGVENFLSSGFGSNYKNLTSFEGGWLDYCVNIGAQDSYGWLTEELTKVMANKLYQAVLKDAEEGTLIKYNVGSYNDMDKYEESFVYRIHFRFEIEDKHLSTASFWDKYYDREDESEGSAYISTNFDIAFGKDCKNIIQALIDTGIIESEDVLLWTE